MAPVLDPTALRVPSRDKPTLFNRDAGLGYILGCIAGAFLGGVALWATGGVALAPYVITSLSSAAIGAIWGGVAGKRRMERELVEGAPVHRPSFWNKNIFSGLAIGGILFGLTSLALSFTVGPEVVGLAPEQIANSIFTPFEIIGMASVPVSAIAGGLYGRSKQAARYAEAEQKLQQSPELALGLSRARTLEPGLAPQRSAEYRITPQEQVALETRMKQGAQRNGSFAEMLTGSRDEKNLSAGKGIG